MNCSRSLSLSVWKIIPKCHSRLSLGLVTFIRYKMKNARRKNSLLAHQSPYRCVIIYFWRVFELHACCIRLCCQPTQVTELSRDVFRDIKSAWKMLTKTILCKMEFSLCRATSHTPVKRLYDIRYKLYKGSQNKPKVLKSNAVGSNAPAND